jgi:hypothetical protein
LRMMLLASVLGFGTSLYLIPTVSPSFDPCCITQPLVVSIASKKHPVSLCQCEEAKR